MQPSPPTAEVSALRPGEALARFAERRGIPVVEALGVFWWRRNRHFFNSLPPHHVLDFEPRQVEAVLRARRLLGLTHPSSCGRGEPGGLFVCRTPGFSLSRVEKRRRNKVRQGLAHTELRRMDSDELLALGLPLNLETMARQRRFAPEFGVSERWARFVRAVRDTPEVEVCGAFVDGRLATYVLAVRDGAWLHGLVKMQRTEDLALNTSCALDAYVLFEAARDPTLEGVVNGYVDGADPHLVHYKRTMGFEVLEQHRVIHLHPALRFLTRPWTARAAGTLATRLPRARPLHSFARAVAASQLEPSP